MIIAVLLIICAIVFILALIYIIGCLVAKHMLSTRKKYQEHIRGHLSVDDLVEEPFPPYIQTPDVQTAIDQLQTSNEDLWRQEAKRTMVANIRTYFNQRKINAKISGSDELAPVNPSTGSYEYRGPYEDLTYPTPPSIERI